MREGVQFFNGRWSGITYEGWLTFSAAFVSRGLGSLKDLDDVDLDYANDVILRIMDADGGSN